MFFRFFNVAARLVGICFLIGSACLLLGALVTPDAWLTSVLVGLFAAAVGIGLLVAKPVRGDEVERFFRPPGPKL